MSDTSDKYTYIYGLVDPRTNQVRYVGKSNNPKERFKQHLRECRRDYPIYAWIRKLGKLGLSPELKVLKKCLKTEWEEHEINMIAEYRSKDKILNLAEGGQQPLVSLEVLRKTAVKMAKKRPPHVMRAYRRLESSIRVSKRRSLGMTEKLEHAKQTLTNLVQRHRIAGTLDILDERLSKTMVGR